MMDDPRDANGNLTADDLREVRSIFREVSDRFVFSPYSADHDALGSLVMDLAINEGYRGERLRHAADRFAQRLKATE